MFLIVLRKLSTLHCLLDGWMSKILHDLTRLNLENSGSKILVFPFHVPCSFPFDSRLLPG